MKLPNFSNEALLLLHADPPVIYMMDWVFRSPSAAPWLLLQALRRRRCHVLVQLSWTHESAGMAARLEKRVTRYARRYPGHGITILANTLAEQQAVEEFCAAPPDSAHIRQSTLQKFSEDRHHFMQRMRDLVAGRDPEGVWANGWPEGLPHKLCGGGFTLRDNLAAVRMTGQPAPWRASSGPVPGR